MLCRRRSDDDDDSVSSESLSRRLSDFDSEDDNDDIMSTGTRSRSGTPRGDRRKEKLKRSGLTYILLVADCPITDE